jgi:hypothetical protein
MNAPNQQPAINNQQPRYKCRHIFTDGRRCASPSLRQENFCYFHHTTRKPPETQKERRRTTARLSEFHLPLPEDRSAIQASIGMVLQRIASNDLDPRRAGLLLYGLQIASLNLKQNKQNASEQETEVVEEITNHPELGTLAPQTEIKVKRSSAAILLEELTRHQQPKPAVLPLIQATAQISPKLQPKAHRSAPTAQSSHRSRSVKSPHKTAMNTQPRPVTSPGLRRYGPGGAISAAVRIVRVVSADASDRGKLRAHLGRRICRSRVGTRNSRDRISKVW